MDYNLDKLKDGVVALAMDRIKVMLDALGEKVGPGNLNLIKTELDRAYLDGSIDVINAIKEIKR